MSGANLRRKLLLALILVLGIPSVIVLAGVKPERVNDVLPDEVQTIDESLFRSNQYTQMDDLSVVENHLDVPGSFTKVGENARLMLYAENPNGAIRVVDKETNYIYGSSFAARDVNIEHFNTRWEGIINSAVVIEYYTYNETTGAYVISEESFFMSPETTLSFSLIENGYELDVTYGISGISLKVLVYLDDDYLRVAVPREYILESDTYPLRSIKVFPFLGAVYGNSIPGYIFVPDGSGALIRYKEIGTVTDIYELNYYGTDAGITKTADVSLNFTLPVSGMILGIKQNGFIQIIESGDPFATLVVSPAKNNLRYYYTYNNFVFRRLYLAPTSRSAAASGSGQQVIENARNSCDIKLVYAFLTGESADYVGMANSYQDYLRKHNVFATDLEIDEIPIMVELIGADTSPGFIFDTLNVMTTYTEALALYQDLKTYIPALTTIYKGYGRGGYSNDISRGLSDRRLGSLDELITLIEECNSQQDSLYLYANFQSVFQSAQYNAYRDLSQRIDSSFHTFSGLNDPWYYLNPLRTQSLIEAAYRDFSDLHAENIALGSIGYRLYSDYKNRTNPIDRAEAVSIYQEALEQTPLKTAIYRPNAYLLKYADKYLAAPTTTTGYHIYTDTVPFLSMVLAGALEAYGPYANFYANTTSELLILIDHGLLPSFIISNQPAYLLEKSELGKIYSSDYQIWKERIQSVYDTVVPAYEAFYGERVQSREILSAGIVKTTYGNGVTIYINHTDQTYLDGSLSIPALAFEVVIPDA